MTSRLEEIRQRARSFTAPSARVVLADLTWLLTELDKARAELTQVRAARGWEHSDRDSLALVLDKTREAGFTAGLHAARDVDRLGYVLVEKRTDSRVITEGLALDSMLWSRDAAERARFDYQRDADDPGLTYAIAEVIEVEEATP